MNAGLFDESRLQQAISDLRADLIRDGGPQISTMRNYRFAILQYDPQEEFALRAEVRKLGTSLISNGWVVLTIDLQKLMLDRIRREGDEFAARLITMEKRLDRNRGLAMLSEKISHLIPRRAWRRSLASATQKHSDRIYSLLLRPLAGGEGRGEPG